MGSFRHRFEALSGHFDEATAEKICTIFDELPSSVEAALVDAELAALDGDLGYTLDHLENVTNELLNARDDLRLLYARSREGS